MAEVSTALLRLFEVTKAKQWVHKMAIGGHSTLTEEQKGRCLLLGIWVHSGMPQSLDWWFVSRQVDDGPLTIMIGPNGEMKKYNTANEAIEDAAAHMDVYSWR